MKTSESEKGFTLIELMLSMAFIAFLLLFTVSVITQVTMLYTKGVATRQINQTGRQVVDSIGRGLRDAKPKVFPADKRLCANGITYAWNTYGTPTINNFDGAGDTRIGFISIVDPGEVHCVAGGGVIPRATAKDIFGKNLTVIDFSVTKSGSLWDIDLFLSTSGDNVVQDVGGGKYECETTNKFCAFGEFNTSVYNRRS